MAEKRKSREELESELTVVRGSHQAAVADLTTARNLDRHRRAEIDDLKERLAYAETECQRMRGYIARVQEDDVVREDLVATGDRDGEQQLVPKRKPTPFHAPSAYTPMSGANTCSFTEGRDRPKPKHWVTY